MPLSRTRSVLGQLECVTFGEYSHNLQELLQKLEHQATAIAHGTRNAMDDNPLTMTKRALESNALELTLERLAEQSPVVLSPQERKIYSDLKTALTWALEEGIAQDPNLLGEEPEGTVQMALCCLEAILGEAWNSEDQGRFSSIADFFLELDGADDPVALFCGLEPSQFLLFQAEIDEYIGSPDPVVQNQIGSIALRFSQLVEQSLEQVGTSKTREARQYGRKILQTCTRGQNRSHNLPNASLKRPERKKDVMQSIE